MEVDRRMPGDEIVVNPTFVATRAVTIHADPGRIWPWIVQIGYKKAGFYSWDFLDNGGIPSTRRVIPEYQDLRVGDRIPLSDDDSALVSVLETNEYLVLVFEPDTLGTWAWGLYEGEAGTTRLVTRLRVRTASFFSRLMLEYFEIIMMRKHMLGIRDRAEAR